MKWLVSRLQQDLPQFPVQPRWAADKYIKLTASVDTFRRNAKCLQCLLSQQYTTQKCLKLSPVTRSMEMYTCQTYGKGVGGFWDDCFSCYLGWRCFGFAKVELHNIVDIRQSSASIRVEHD